MIDHPNAVKVRVGGIVPGEGRSSWTTQVDDPGTMDWTLDMICGWPQVAELIERYRAAGATDVTVAVESRLST